VTRILAALLFLSCVAAADDRVAIDKQAVRVLKVLEQPHQKTPLHQHVYNRVIVYLDAGEMTVHPDRGLVEVNRYAAGQVTWSPAGGKHISENSGNAPMRIVEIELKNPAPKTPPPRSPALDPVTLDPEHNVLLFENPQVRVFRSWREPGAQEKMHEHVGAGRVAILLTDIHAQVKLADGTSSKLDGSAGEALWSLPVKHAATNLGSKKFEMIIVEVK